MSALPPFLSKSARRTLGYDILFMLPALLVFTIFFIYPVLTSFPLSLTKWNGISPDYKFVGMRNFVRILSDRHFWQALENTFQYAILVTLLQNVIGLSLALAVTSKAHRPVRTLFLVPPLLSSIALGMIWSYMYRPDGAINGLLTLAGLENWTQNWLGDPNLALYALVVTNIWKWTGMSMIIYLAAILAIPQEIQEAASIDGVGVWQRFRHITFPLIAPAFTINIVLSMIGSLKVFDIIFIMTQGGPGRATESLTTYIFKRAFDAHKFGYAIAVAVVMFVIIMTLSLIQMRYLTRREVRA